MSATSMSNPPTAARPPPPPGDEENPYLRLRREKIARNKARLESLGLLRNKTITRSRSSPAASAASAGPGRPTKPIPSEPLRRSARNAGKDVDYKQVPDAALAVRTIQPRGRVAKKRVRANDDDDDDDDDASAPVAIPTSSKPSTRTTDANVGAIVRRWLGTEIESFGKAAVIDVAVADDHPPGRISFNKYSGVCEWRNALFLWVNIGAPGSDVVNDFLDGGRKMTWFGGSRMHDDTPAIRRLIRMGRKAHNLPDTDGIVLWCRLYDSVKRCFGNYVCLGHVGYDSHIPGTRPMEFVLRLLDFDEMAAQGGAKGLGASEEPSLFRQIIDF